MITEHVSNYENRDFDNFLNIQIYIQGFIFLENEEDRNFKITLPYNDIEIYRMEKIEILKPMIEEKVKKYLVEKIKEKCNNVVEWSRRLDIPVQHILHCYFINNRIDNIDIIWGGSAIKEFTYIPIRHYLDYKDDFILLKIKSFKFKRKL